MGPLNEKYFCPFINGRCQEVACMLYLKSKQNPADGECTFRSMFDALVLSVRQNREIKKSLADEFIEKAKEVTEKADTVSSEDISQQLPNPVPATADPPPEVLHPSTDIGWSTVTEADEPGWPKK